jgi:type II secretory pathway pseudopilin PulG
MSSKKNRQQGFTLIEALVAIVLNSFGNQLTQATFLAQDKLEELRLLNECYLAVQAKPAITWTAADQNVVNNYNSQLSDAENNWIIDTDSDGNDDDFDWINEAPDHTNADGPGAVANPIDVTGAAAPVGGYTRTWNIVDNVPVTKAKTLHVRITWGNGRELILDTALSQ